ncbi:MAG: type II secretion system F family protein [Selenomonadaceae bacterium]|nr:type II secretion system F family protein [Selenomonadaceae bacterium]MBR3721796.1 type II secretion system F family protein [Selenomonadaceae bacterium]
MILAAALASGLFVFMLVYFFVMTKLIPKTQVQQRLRDIKYGSKEKREEAGLDNLEEIPFLERTIVPFFQGLTNTLMKFAPAGIHAMIENRIMMAGKLGVWSVNAFVCGWILSVAVCFLLAFMYVSNGVFPFVQRTAIVMLGIFIGGFLPFAILNSMIQKRQKAITKQLPEFLDLLCVSVQAGLSFDGGVSKIVSRMKGPLIDECVRMQRDVRMGMPRARSLRQMGQRCDVQEVYLFTTSVIQAERLGTSMAATLENQANNMRERRRQRAKAEALKAPVKILLPLVMFIFPALFVVVLLPSVLFLMKSF